MVVWSLHGWPGHLCIGAGVEFNVLVQGAENVRQSFQPCITST